MRPKRLEFTVSQNEVKFPENELKSGQPRFQDILIVERQPWVRGWKSGIQKFHLTSSP